MDADMFGLILTGTLAFLYLAAFGFLFWAWWVLVHKERKK